MKERGQLRCQSIIRIQDGSEDGTLGRGERGEEGLTTATTTMMMMMMMMTMTTGVKARNMVEGWKLLECWD